MSCSDPTHSNLVRNMFRSSKITKWGVYFLTRPFPTRDIDLPRDLLTFAFQCIRSWVFQRNVIALKTIKISVHPIKDGMVRFLHIMKAKFLAILGPIESWAYSCLFLTKSNCPGLVLSNLYLYLEN